MSIARDSVTLPEAKPEAKPKGRSKVSALSKTDLLELISYELNRKGISIEASGSARNSKEALNKLFGTLIDICLAATVAGGRVALAGLGTFWIKNCQVKFRASRWYKKAIREFMKTIEVSDDVTEAYHQFRAFVNVMDSAKKRHKRNVEFLADLM
jgi:nucleoid DNA-binding protein